MNFRTADLAVACLHSLAEEAKALPGITVVLVDNASGDDSVQRFQEKISHAKRQFGWMAGPRSSLWIKTEDLRLGTTQQFGRCWERSKCPTTCCCSTRILWCGLERSRHWWNSWSRRRPQGIAGSRLEDPDGTPQRSAFLFPNVWSELNDGIHLRMIERLVQRSKVAPPVRNEAHQTDWVAGASFIIRRELIEQIGLLG